MQPFYSSALNCSFLWAQEYGTAASKDRKKENLVPHSHHSPNFKSPGERTKASSRSLVLHSMLERVGPTYFHSRPVEAAVSSGRGYPFSDMTSHTESHTQTRAEDIHINTAQPCTTSASLARALLASALLKNLGPTDSGGHYRIFIKEGLRNTLI